MKDSRSAMDHTTQHSMRRGQHGKADDRGEKDKDSTGRDENRGEKNKSSVEVGEREEKNRVECRVE